MATMRERRRELGPGLVSGAADIDPNGGSGRGRDVRR
jgi:hypothetical protein